MPLKDRNNIHLPRRLWHLGGVLFIFTFYCFLTPTQAVWTILPVATVMIGFDFARLYSRRLSRFFQWAFKPFLRQSELNRLAASTSMMAGVTFVIVFFPRPVVLLSLLFLAVADPVASFFGIRYGKDKLIGSKTLQGSLAAFVACFILSWFFFTQQDLMAERRFIACLLAGIIGAVSELVPIGKLDDNLVFPVLSAILLSGLFYVFGGLTP